MNKYSVYVGGIWFASKLANTEDEAIALAKDQIEHLHPLNMSDENVEAYRNRYRGKEITAKYLYKV